MLDIHLRGIVSNIINYRMYNSVSNMALSHFY